MFISYFYSFVTLIDALPQIGNQLLTSPTKTLENYDVCATEAQKILLKDQSTQDASRLSIKKNTHVRIYGLPTCPEMHRTTFSRNFPVNSFLRVVGNKHQPHSQA